MKTIVLRFLLLLWLTVPAITAPAALFYSWTGTQTIPDNDGSGRAFSFNVSDPATAITDIAVTLDISGGFNGDLYVYLSQSGVSGGFAVLVNRVGRTSANDLGYANTGFLVTLTGSAAADIHNYQTLSPSYNVSGQLTGLWGADGRFVDPDSSGAEFDAATRDATLNGFNGLNPNGDWTLFFADTSPGGISTLNSFSVDITAVPEPVNVALGVFGVVLAGFGVVRRLCVRSRQPE